MNIHPDWTAAVALFVPFLVTLVGLWLILWRPLLAHLDERKGAVTSAQQDAKRLSNEADARIQRIEAGLAQAESAGRDARQVVRQVALAEEDRIVAEARRESESRVAGAVAEIRVAAEAASRVLRSQAAQLAGDIATRALGRGEA